MKILDDCLELRRKINDISENIQMLQEVAYAPRNQVLNGMPRGGGENAIEKYIDKVEKLNKRKRGMTTQLNRYWNRASIVFENCEIDEQAVALMKFRFYDGLSWKRCCKVMQKLYPDDKWNENKCFRTYRVVLSKINKGT